MIQRHNTNFKTKWINLGLISNDLVRYERAYLVTTNYKQWRIIRVKNTWIELVSTAIQLIHTLAIISWSKWPHLDRIFTYRGQIVTCSIPTNRLDVLYVSLHMNRSSYYSEHHTDESNVNCDTKLTTSNCSGNLDCKQARYSINIFANPHSSNIRRPSQTSVMMIWFVVATV